MADAAARRLRVAQASRERILRLAPDADGWLDAAPALFEGLARRWRCEVGYFIGSDGPTLVARAVRGLQPLVIKAAYADDGALAREAAILHAAGGRAYPRLLDFDGQCNALLGTALGERQRVPDELMPLEGDVEAITALLQAAWEVPLAAAGTPAIGAVDRVTTWLLDAVAAGDVPAGPLADRVAGWALERREAPVTAPVVLHGHPSAKTIRRVLDADAPLPLALTSPLGWVGPREYDLAQVLVRSDRSILAADDPVVLLRSWCARLAMATGTDAEAIWQWNLVQRVTRAIASRDQAPFACELRLRAASALVTRRR